MPRILAIDYGKKRSGIAVTDPLKIIATGLTAVNTHELRDFLKRYMSSEAVEKVIIGLPKNLDGGDTDATAAVRSFIRLFKKDHPAIPLETVDESFTSKLAVQALIESGVKKKDRQNKKVVDEMAATIILQDYLKQLG